MESICKYWSNRTPMTHGPFVKMKTERYLLQNYMHDIFDFDGWKGKRVLEIGCGSGIDTTEFVLNGAEVYATDITDNAIRHTKDALAHIGMSATVLKMRGEDLAFRDETFDLVYSFGVLHHSPDIEKIISEIYRVLKPGGKAYVMLYNRNSALYHYSIIYLRGMVQGLLKTMTPNEILSKYSEYKEDCPYTRAYTKEEAIKLFERFSFVEISVEFPVVDEFTIRKVKLPKLPKRFGWHLIIKAVK